MIVCAMNRYASGVKTFNLFQFDAAGLRVAPLLQWLPSGNGLRESGWVIKEWLGLLLI
jgi:hypothetical protein